MLYLKILCSVLVMFAAYLVFRRYAQQQKAGIRLLEEIANDLLTVKSRIVLEKVPIADIFVGLCVGSSEKVCLYQKIIQRLRGKENCALREVFVQEAGNMEHLFHMKNKELEGFVFSADAIEQTDTELCEECIRSAEAMLKKAADSRREEFRQRAAMVRGIIFLAAASLCLLIL